MIKNKNIDNKIEKVIDKSDKKSNKKQNISVKSFLSKNKVRLITLMILGSLLAGCGNLRDILNQEDLDSVESSGEELKNKEDEQAEKEAKEAAEKEAKEQAEKEAAEKEAKEQAEKEAKEAAEKEAAEKEAKEQAEKEAKEQAEKEAKEAAEKEAGEIGEPASLEVWTYENSEAIKEIWEDYSYWYSEPNSYIKTLAMFEDSKKIISNNSLSFKNKKIIVLGDSITYGSGSSEIAPGQRLNYAYYLEEIFGCSIENVSFPGATIGSYLIGNNIINQADSVKPDADIIIVFGGVNDFISYNYSYGDDFDTRGYYKGDAKFLMQKLREKCPEADIFFITTYRNREQEDPNIPQNIPFDNYMSVQKELAGGYNIHMIDIYRQGFLDNHDDQSYHEFFYDLIHPNDDGSRVLGKYIAAQIISYYYKDYIDKQG